MNITARNNFTYVVCLYAGTNSCILVLTYSFMMIITNFSENERSLHTMIPVYQNGANPYALDRSGTLG